MKRRKLALTYEEEDGLVPRQGNSEAFDDDEEDDNEDMDQFETDGFLVFDNEEDDEVESNQDGKGKQHKEKKRKMRSLKDLVLDEDDIELIQENKTSGLCLFPNDREKFKRLKKTASRSTKVVEQSNVSDDEGLLFDDILGDEDTADDNKEDEMANFVVNDGEPYGQRSLVRYFEVNQKKFEQVVTICSSALNDAGPIIGDASKILNQQKQKEVLAMEVKPEDSIEFEPYFLADKYITERNNHVRDTDVPERMQMIEEIVGALPLGQLSREEESVWILNQLVFNTYLLFCKKRTPQISEEGSIVLNKIKKTDIMKFLELHHVDKFDVPFISMYRKEQCRSLLDNIEQDEAEDEHNNDVGRAWQLKWHKVLWVIKELDRKWLLLQKRKSALRMYQRKHYDEESLNIEDSDRFTFYEKMFESISKSLENAESEEEIDDVDAKFRLHFPSVDGGVDGKFKRPIKKSLYTNCMKADLWKVANQFGCNSEQLSLQIAFERTVGEFQEHPDRPPEEIASDFTCAMFETPELVLKGARHMAAIEIGSEPGIKKHIRSIFMDKAVVSTSPTPEGNLTIDCSHQFFGVKWLRDKPVSKFNDAQWLFIQKAEEGKLLQVSIKLPESTLNEVMNSFNDAYIILGAGRSTQLWKEQCKLILNNAFFNFILPDMEKEARKLLTFRAKHWLLMDYGKELWKMVSVGPYLYNDNSIDSMETFSAKVMSCCWGPGKPPMTFVMLDSSGELLDVLETGAFILRSQTIDAQQRKKHDQQRVLKFIKIHQPHVIVIGAGNPSCVRLKDDVKEIVSKMEENLGDLGQAINGISVIYGDESLPQLYEVSQISSDQLPGQPGIVKRAVALGRYLQNPLAMIATLCGAGREIISWKLSSLDHFLTPDEKYEMIEQVMVDVTNQVGFDINFAVNHDWYLPLLQFISGLGPQKAAVLQRELSGNGAINNRRELASFGIKTKKVFHNAVGFLSVRCRQLSCSSFDIDLLDDTRIHPESYELAERLTNAVCKDVTEAPIGYVKKEPQVLSTFDINDFSDNYEIEEGENKRETFDHIKTELLHGFRDPRKPYKVPSLDEEFNLICGKNGTALAEGRLIQAIVRHVLSKRAFCVLDSGLTGIISKEDFSDEVHEDDSFSLEAKLHEGDKVSCKIKQIDKSRCQVLLTCKESEMKTSTLEDICEVDPYYHKGWSILLKQAEKAVMDENLVMKHFKPRIISHPCFTNMTMDEAKEFLSDKDVGESIFCPSPRGPSYLTLTLKVFDELYVNKEIIEGGKDHNDITSFLHLGKTLKIGDDTFGDLDEVMDQYVVPLVKHLKEMLGFRKFRRGSKAEIDEALRAEKSEYPLRIVYGFGVSHEHPGTFILSYIRNVNLHHEYVGLLPSGFRFRKRTFKKIEHLVAFFQKNIDDLQHKSLTLEKPGLRNSSSLYTGGGWQDQLNSSNDRSVPGGSNNDYHRDESGLKKHLSALPSPPNGPGSGLSSGATNWGSCSKDLPGGWGSGADTSGGKWNSGDGRGSGSTGGWGSTKNSDDDGDENNGVWLTGRDNVSGCGRGLGRGGARGHGRGVGCSSGWDGNKEDDNGGSFGTNEGVWHSGRNNRGRCNGGRSSGWGGAKEDKSGGSFGLNGGVWHASESNSGGRGCGPGRGFGGGGSWGSTKEGGSDGGFGGDEEAWHATGNDFHGDGHGGGEHDDGHGRGRGGRGGSWNNDRGDYGPGRGRGGRGGSWNSDRGDYGPGHGRGGRGGNWNNDRGDYGPGRGRGGRDGNWNSDRGNDGPRHGRGGRVGSWNRDRGDDGPGNGRGGRGSSWSSDRGGRRGSGSSWRGSRRGRCCSNNGADNSHRGSEFGGNSSSWGCNTSSWGCNNEDRKWNHDKETNFHNGSTSGNWGSNNVNSDRDNNGMTGNSSGGSWNANAEAFVGGSSWKPREGIVSGVNSAGRSWDNTNNNSRGILGSRPDNWGGNVGGNQEGWSSGWQGANVMNKDSETPNTSRDGPGNKWGESSKGGW